MDQSRVDETRKKAFRDFIDLDIEEDMLRGDEYKAITSLVNSAGQHSTRQSITDHQKNSEKVSKLIGDKIENHLLQFNIPTEVVKADEHIEAHKVKRETDARKISDSPEKQKSMFTWTGETIMTEIMSRFL